MANPTPDSKARLDTFVVPDDYDLTALAGQIAMISPVLGQAVAGGVITLSQRAPTKSARAAIVATATGDVTFPLGEMFSVLASLARNSGYDAADVPVTLASGVLSAAVPIELPPGSTARGTVTAYAYADLPE